MNTNEMNTTTPMSIAPTRAIHAFYNIHLSQGRPPASRQTEAKLFFKQSFGKRFARSVGTLHEFEEVENLQAWFRALDVTTRNIADTTAMNAEEFAAIDSLLEDIASE